MSLNDKLAALFKAHPGQWLDGRQLAEVAGAYAWRSRCSDLRTQRGMTIENRQRHFDHFTISEYRYLPPVEPEQLPLIEGESQRILSENKRGRSESGGIMKGAAAHAL